MKTSIKIYIFIVMFLVVGVAVFVLFPQEQKKNPRAVLKIGAGDDVSGLLMDETLAALDGRYKVEDVINSTYFQDCCSNTAQWALTAKEINLAFCCGHIAQYTMEQNPEVVIYGPVIMNSEVISYSQQWEAVQTVGMIQGRSYLKEKVSEAYGQVKQFTEISQKGILYALEDEQIDAAVLDLTKAAQVTGNQSMPVAEQDYVSYVLIVDKTLLGTAAFDDFIAAYSQAVEKLNEPQYLSQQLGVDSDWLADKKIKFLALD